MGVNEFELYKDGITVIFIPNKDGKSVGINGIEYPLDKARKKWLSYKRQGYTYIKDLNVKRNVKRAERIEEEKKQNRLSQEFFRLTSEWHEWVTQHEIDEVKRNKLYVPEWDDNRDPGYTGPPHTWNKNSNEEV